MSNFTKKIVAIATALTLCVMIGGAAKGVTVDELQAQINALLAQLATLQGQTTGGTVSGCTITSFDANLAQGSTGAAVKCLQIILNSDAATQVAASGVGSAGNETTYFGAMTKAAVIKFQDKYAAEVLTPSGLTAGTGYVGAKTRAKLNTMIGSSGVITPVGNPLTVALAASNPAGANIQKGTANNSVLKITLTGSATGATYVTGLVLKSYGNASDSSITAVKLFDENNVQVSTDRTVIGGLSSFVIVPALVIPANGYRTVTVTANVHASADTLTTVQLGVDAASSIAGATFGGTYPVKGNAFTVVPAGTLGTMTLADYATPATIAVKIGAKDVILESFIVSAGSREDVVLNQMTVTGSSTQTISDSDITNIRIREVGGAVVAGPANLTNKKATLNLTSPVTLLKGTSRKFEVIADIASGNARTILAYLTAGSIIGVGGTSGVNLVNTGATAPTTITIGVGQLVVAQSTNHPTGTGAAFIKTTNSKTLAVFSVRAVGENVMNNSIVVSFTGASPVLAAGNYLSSVGLYDGDTLISDLKDTVTANGSQTFTLNQTIAANTTKDISVKAVTNNLNPSTAETMTIAWVSSTGYGLSSGESVDTSTTVTLTAVTVYPTGTFTVAMDTTLTPYSQGVLEPSTGILLASMKIRAQREDMKLYSLVLYSTSTATTSAAVSSITLYDTDGVTQLSYPISIGTGAATGTFSFAAADLLNPVIFQKDVYKTVFIKGNPIATTSAGYSLQLAASGMVMTGNESQVSATTTAVIFNNAIQGLFTFTTNILEVKKNSTSPSGTPARGTTQTYAIWDITNVTSGDLTITNLVLTSKTGLPSGISATATTMFRLVDENDTIVASTATTTDYAAGTVTFSNANIVGGALTIPAASSKALKLQVNTTNATIWPLGTQMQWTINSVSNVTVSGALGRVGYGGSVWSIPADCNVVAVP